MSSSITYNDKANEWSAAVWSSPPALSYLRGRGISDESIRAWQIGYCDDLSIMGRRVTFPTFDLDRRAVSVSGRTICSANPKSWHFPFRKERYLFGLQLLTPCPFVILCEGQIDAVLCRQQGFFTVAVMGSSLSPIAASLLRLFTETVCVYPDNESRDPKAYEKALKWVEVLKSVGLNAVFPQRPYRDGSCDDPADLIWDRKLKQMNEPGYLKQQIEMAVASVGQKDALEV